jgi:Ca2+-binding EF-hand superfamily protein
MERLMSNGISSIGSTAAQSTSAASTKFSKANLSKMVDDAFSKIDTKGQGYLDKADLESALGGISGSGQTDASASADAMLKALDGNSDGKVTKQEMSDGLEKLASALDSQFDNMRTRDGQHAHNGSPSHAGGGKPSGADGAGFSKDELTTMATQAADSGSQAAANLSSLVASFDQADTDGDGKVSFQEAQAFRAGDASASASSASGSSAPGLGASDDHKVMGQIMRLIASYGSADAEPQAGNVSVAA